MAILSSGQLKVALKFLPREISVYSVKDYFQINGQDSVSQIGYHIQVIKRLGLLKVLRKTQKNLVIYENTLSELKCEECKKPIISDEDIFYSNQDFPFTICNECGKSEQENFEYSMAICEVCQNKNIQCICE